jgi:hypothetical protein
MLPATLLLRLTPWFEVSIVLLVPLSCEWCDAPELLCPWVVQVMNWRSDIMNFTLSLIYPVPDDEGFKNISITELVCVINADQTCSSSFFVTLLRYIDSGDDIAAAICPRISYNVDGDSDVFDQQRVAYYEKTQLGMDAYGFTACMFSNMLLRARALQEIGWFPNKTLSENWEMGMLLVRHLFCLTLMFTVIIVV